MNARVCRDCGKDRATHRLAETRKKEKEQGAVPPSLLEQERAFKSAAGSNQSTNQPTNQSTNQPATTHGTGNTNVRVPVQCTDLTPQSAPSYEGPYSSMSNYSNYTNQTNHTNMFNGNINGNIISPTKYDDDNKNVIRTNSGEYPLA